MSERVSEVLLNSTQVIFQSQNLHEIRDMSDPFNNIDQYDLINHEVSVLAGLPMEKFDHVTKIHNSTGIVVGLHQITKTCSFATL